PAGAAFTADGRLTYTNTGQNPEGYWSSELPSGTTTNYDNFTAGTASNDAVIFNFSPVQGIIDTIQEINQFGSMFALLGASSIRQIYGSSPDQPPTPTSINTQTTVQGCARVMPVVINWDLLFVDVNQKKLRGLRYNLAFNQYQANDFNLTSDHLGKSPFVRIVYVKGIPDVVWVLRQDGVLLSFTFNNIENIAGWARHYVGSSGVVQDIASIRNSSGNDELWLIVQRTLNGVTFMSVEVMSQWPTFPQRREFYSGNGNQTQDEANWENAIWEAAKTASFLDASLTYDGTARGLALGASLTPSATGPAGTQITLTASQPVFQSADEGSQLWKCYSSTGSGGGMATILSVNSSTQVTALVTQAFDSTSAIAAGSWLFAVNSVNNLHLYDGLTVSVQADGGAHPAVAVSNGVATLLPNLFAGKIQFGFNYVGMMITQNLDIGGRQGPANSKPRNVKRIRARFKDSYGGYLGSSEYNLTFNLQEIIFRQANQIMNRVPPPFSGVQDLPNLDDWDESVKQVVIIQTDPTPCTVLGLDVEMRTNDPP
ncbi:MAG: hypothetical protein KGL39_31550, partial [Patescibacteria group bacterium]|nr:hypothetical protein [Patescibacteria group bacterium]